MSSDRVDELERTIEVERRQHRARIEDLEQALSITKAELRLARGDVERLRIQLDDLRIIQDDYPCTVLDEGDLNVFIKATMDEKWTQHAAPLAPCSIPWLSIRDWLCELRDYRRALRASSRSRCRESADNPKTTH